MILYTKVLFAKQSIPISKYKENRVWTRKSACCKRYRNVWTFFIHYNLLFAVDQQYKRKTTPDIDVFIIKTIAKYEPGLSPALLAVLQVTQLHAPE